MSRVRTGLLLFSLGFSIVVAAEAITDQKATSLEAGTTYACESETQCQALIKESHSANIAEELYQRAFSLGLAGDIQQANAYSKCSACLDHGSQTWRYSAENFFK